ncbi:hypothetical protein Gogos_011520 [Gossypium gossypioides]|uniref:Alcohol dehydrogenase-like C-terminal domain-containing protein n=1 Tax=Gossypium gossypioides TaxID=34282 RepID=A0A7J9BPL8_GOSGO|nr:hypothetical protein [Gossypium gossypioides]
MFILITCCSQEIRCYRVCESKRLQQTCPRGSLLRNDSNDQVIVEMTGGGVDRSVECTGSIQAMISAFECVHDGCGVAVLVGVPNKDDAFKTHPVNLLNEKTVKGTFFGNYKPRSDIPAVVEKYMNKELELDKFITHTVPFSEINKAFELMLAGEGLRCVIRMDT